MTTDEVLSRVEALADPRARANYEASYPDSPLRSVGVNLSTLRKLARELGRDRALAAELWATDVYELRMLALMIDDPKQITIDQAEAQVEGLEGGQLAHVFASCDATLAKSPIAAELADRWTTSDDAMRRRCGHTLVYELSKSKKKGAPSDDWFAAHLARIDATWRDEGVDGRMALATALMGLGKRSAALWHDALRIARDIGPIHFDPTGRCEPMDVTKHIDHPRVREKLGIA